ncbi:MAG: tRNA methyltransferase [Thaumarchaeota archaeon]|nr:MAG: tRNA methyltransferase [Nitrososphaerota archaeon]
MSDDLKDYLSKLPELEIDLLLESYERPLPEGFRVNTFKASEEHILSRLESKGYRFRKVPWARHGYISENGYELGKTLEHMLGLIYLQGPISMAPVEALDPRPGETVLDLCAAPGSKSTQIAQLLEGRGVVVANDVSYERVKALSSNLQRFGVLNCVITLADGRKYPRFAREFFDKVLVDAPCSSLGIVSKDWGIAKDWSMKLVERLSSLQRQLILAGFDCLKPGGILVYSTCTLTVEENELVVSWLLERRDNARVAEIKLEGLRGRNGFTEYDGLRIAEEAAKTLRIMPYDNWAEGFYIAKIIKEG